MKPFSLSFILAVLNSTYETYILVSEVSNNIFVRPRVANKLALEESNIEDGGVEIDELEDEHFEC